MGQLLLIKSLVNPLSSVWVQEWIMEQWEMNYYISALAGSSNGSSLVVMSKGRRNIFYVCVYYVIPRIRGY